MTQPTEDQTRGMRQQYLKAPAPLGLYKCKAREEAFDYNCCCAGVDERAWVKHLIAFSRQRFGPVLGSSVAEFEFSR